MPVLQRVASRCSLATCKRLEEHGIVLITPTEEFKFTSFTLTCTFSNNYAYRGICICMLLYMYVKVSSRVGLVPMHPSMDISRYYMYWNDPRLKSTVMKTVRALARKRYHILLDSVWKRYLYYNSTQGPYVPFGKMVSIYSLLVAFVQSFSNKRNSLTHAWLMDMVYMILPSKYIVRSHWLDHLLEIPVLKVCSLMYGILCITTFSCIHGSKV